MSNKFAIDELNKLEKMYFYFQDVMIDIITCYHQIHMIENFLQDTNYSIVISTTEKVIFDDKSLNRNSMLSGSRVPFHSLVMAVCKICEVIKNDHFMVLINRLDNTLGNEFKSFSNKFNTVQLREYRNQYVAHPLDHPNPSKGDFLDLNALHNCMQNVLGITIKPQISDVCRYVDQFYTQPNDGENNICSLIEDFSNKLKQELGRDLDRTKL